MSRSTDFEVGDLVHCIKRGAFDNNVFRDDSDRWRFIRLMYFCNDEYQDKNIYKKENTLQLFERPNGWPERELLTDILSFTLMPNHIHLLLRERKKGGIGKFTQRLFGSYAMGFNKKYHNQGTIFQSKYKPVIVTSEEYATYLLAYINVKNVCELYPDGGIEGAVRDYNKAYEWAKTYKFSSLRSWSEGLSSPLLDMDEVLKCRRMEKDALIDFFDKEDDFKEYSFQAVRFAFLKKQEGKEGDFYDLDDSEEFAYERSE